MDVTKSNATKYIFNTLSILIEKAWRMVLSAIVGFVVARYMGPSDFGIYNFAISLVTIFIPIVSLGLDEIIVKELVDDSTHEESVFGTALIMKITLSFLVSVVFWIWAINANFDFKYLITAIVSVSLIFQVFSVVEQYFQAKIQVNKIVMVQMIQSLAGMILKVIALVNKAPLVTFAIIYSIELLIFAIGMAWMIFVKEKISLKFDFSIGRRLLSKSWLLMFSGLASMIYMRIDQVMVQNILGSTQNGYYSAAVKFSELWFFVPVSIAASLFPSLVKSHAAPEVFNKRVQLLMSLLAAISICFAIIIFFFGESIISLTFGDKYLNSMEVLSILAWNGVFVSFGVVSSKWLVIKNYFSYSLIRTLIGAILNIVLNFILIERYGILGAALATLFSQFVAAFFLDLFFKNVRDMFICKLKSIFFIFHLKPIVNELRSHFKSQR